MRILVVNQNTTADKTAKIGRASRAAAAAGTEIIAVNPADGPVSIEGYYDEAFSVPGLLAEISKGDATGISAHIIACFDDTGLEAARCVAQAPVIGIGDGVSFGLVSPSFSQS
jgi:allantoin racemase